MEILKIYRKKGAEYTDRCPICDKKHIHGSAPGTRLSHCASPFERKIYKIIEYL